jgi:hypothetical protein
MDLAHEWPQSLAMEGIATLGMDTANNVMATQLCHSIQTRSNQVVADHPSLNTDSLHGESYFIIPVIQKNGRTPEYAAGSRLFTFWLAS